jgi:hypothetical protein
MSAVSRLFVSLCFSFASVMFSGCSSVRVSPHRGVLVGSSPSYAKFLSEEDVQTVTAIVGRSKILSTESHSIAMTEHQPCADLFGKHVYLSVRNHVLTMHYDFSDSCRVVRVLRMTSPSVRYIHEPSYTRIESESEIKETRTVSAEDSAILYEIFMPWLSEEEERRATMFSGEELEFGIFPPGKDRESGVIQKAPIEPATNRD